MKGLLEKDLRLMLSRKQSILIFIVASLFVAFTMDGSFVVSYLTMLFTVIAISTLSYDEYDNGFAFLMTLPFSRKTYVREKYIFTLLAEIAAWIISVIFYYVVNMIKGVRIDLLSEAPVLLMYLPLLFLMACMMLPIQFRFGAEKSRTAYFIVIGGLAVLLFIVFKLIGSGDGSVDIIETALSFLLSPVGIIMVTAAFLILVAVSYLLSVRIMEKKEF
ncbi:MAG: ABC-2 transporter permease [Clostridia bacterium]|nr:ABC-2 transporter permease [Clostridia bacterium]MBQ5956475.1 ABC-2 transporter permease [Clostridia bacterium]MBR3563855.1 ABC-2 transporter permease [Clostridia bacterium]